MNLNPKTYSYVSKKSNNLILIAVGYIALLLTWFFGVSDKVFYFCLLYTSPSPRDVEESRMPSSA